jgi:hypothetical protein
MHSTSHRLSALILVATLPLAVLMGCGGDDGGDGGGGAGAPTAGGCTCEPSCSTAPEGTVCHGGPASGSVEFTLDSEPVTFSNLRYEYLARVDGTVDIVLTEDTEAYPTFTVLVQFPATMVAPVTAPWNEALGEDDADLQWIYASPTPSFYRAGSLLAETDGAFTVTRFEDGALEGTFSGDFGSHSLTAGTFNAAW